MTPMTVFVAAEGYGIEACSVEDWREAWCAIDRCYSGPDGDDGPLAWVVCMTEGSGPVTQLRMMERSMWRAIAETPDALLGYLLATGHDSDIELQAYLDTFEDPE